MIGRWSLVRIRKEINRSFIEANDIRVVRRMTGGGAVYHDLGNLNYSFITDSGAREELSMEVFTRPVAEALRGLGLDAEVSGRNDILVGEKKVSGTAQRLMQGRILHHGTLLFDSNPDMVAGALRVDPSKFQSKSSKSVRSRIGNIREQLLEDMELSAFWKYLKDTLTGQGFLQDTLTEEKLAEVEKLRKEKYATWEWTFGMSPKFGLSNKRRFSGGSLEIGLCVEAGHIKEVAFFGDFLARSSLEPLTIALTGCAFRAEAVAVVMNQFPLQELFGTITQQEILDTMFHAGDM